jgi:transcriptional regulator with XRE-family HTH domain
MMKDKYKEHLSSVGKKLRAARLTNNWSQEDVASRCDTVNAAKISKMENAREDYNFSTLLEVCDALNVDVSIIVST